MRRISGKPCNRLCLILIFFSPKQFFKYELSSDYSHLGAATDLTCETVVKLFCAKGEKSQIPECEKKLKSLFIMEIPKINAENFTPISMALDTTNSKTLKLALDLAFHKLSYATRWPYQTTIENNQLKISNLRHGLKSLIFGGESSKFYTRPIALSPIAEKSTKPESLSITVNHVNEVEKCLPYMEGDRAANRKEIVYKLSAVVMAREDLLECIKSIFNVINPILKEKSPIRKADQILKKLNNFLGQFDTLQANYLMTLVAVNDKFTEFYEKWTQFIMGHGPCADLIESDKVKKAQAKAIKMAPKTTSQNAQNPNQLKPIGKPKKWNFNLMNFLKKMFK